MSPPAAPWGTTIPAIPHPLLASALVWALQEVRRVLSFEPLSARGIRELLPGPRVQSVPELEDYIRCGSPLFNEGGCDRTQLPANHLAGTCRLGDAADRTAVVDLQLQVIGVTGLRVADASVMPRPPSGNTHATCVMIGERAADFILAKRYPRNPSTTASTQSGAPPPEKPPQDPMYSDDDT